MDRRVTEDHLTDAELLALAAPASGEPEPLPRHLLGCEACSRALQEWRSAMREAAREDVAELERRTPEEWRAAADATMAAVRRVKPRRTTAAVRWAIGIAAAALVVALAMPFRRPSPPPVAAGEASDASEPALASDLALVSEADRADDALLRDAEYLAQGGDDHADIALEESL
jgi:hypothetical protein